MYKSLLIVYLFFLSLSLIGQDEFSQSDHIGSADGLSGQLCNKIIEDDYGNIWIALQKDFIKYDGFNGKDFNLLNSFVDEKFAEQIALDQKGLVWLIRSEGKNGETIQNLFNHVIGDYSIYLVDPLSDKAISFNEIFPNAPFELANVENVRVRNRTLFFLTISGELYRYDDEFELILKDVQKESFIGVESETHYFQLLENSKIARISFEKGSTDTLDLYDYNATPFLCFEQTGGLVISSHNAEEKQISIWKDKKISTVEKKLRETEALENLKTLYVRVKVDIKNNLISQNGYIDLKEWGATLEENRVVNRRYCNDFLVSKSGLLYVATALGIYVFNNNKPIISNVNDVSSSLYSMRKMIMDDDVTFRVKDDKEYIASNSNKYNTDFINESEKTTGMIEHYQDPLDSSVYYSTGWSFNHDIRVIDFKNETVSRIENEVIKPSFGIIRSSTTGLLYVFGPGGIAPYSSSHKAIVDNKIWSNSSYGKEFRTNSTYQINFVTEHDSKLWISTTRGIIVYDELNNQASEEYEALDLLGNVRIQYLHFDKFDQDILWVGTSNIGLKKLNLKTKELKSFDDSNGFSNNSIHYIYQDEKNRLWVSTNHLLNCLDVETEVNYIFTENEGIAHPEFNTHSYYKNDKTGYLYLGGLGGFSYFQPDSVILDKEKLINVNLISVNKIDDMGQPIKDELRSIYAEGLSMHENHSSLNIELGTNFHFKNDKKIFSYKVPPFLNEWKELKRNELILPRLPYGDYKLHFISDANNPTYSSNELVLDLFIERPFYKTWLFLLLCLLLLSLLVWLFVGQRTRAIKNRNIILEGLVEKRTNQLEKANKSKTRIFQILAHDLRSPIASLSNLTNVVAYLSSKNRLSDLETIAEETEMKVNALNDNLDNLLQWAIIEKGNITNKPVQVNISEEFKNLLTLYNSQIESKQIQLKNYLKSNDQALVDITIFQTISRNGLHNAVKFCKEGGRIDISFQQSNGKSNISISNTFDSELSNSEEQKGSGLGFQISQELANLSNGQVQLELDENGMTKFDFSFRS